MKAMPGQVTQDRDCSLQIVDPPRSTQVHTRTKHFRNGWPASKLPRTMTERGSFAFSCTAFLRRRRSFLVTKSITLESAAEFLYVTALSPRHQKMPPYDFNEISHGLARNTKTIQVIGRVDFLSETWPT